MTRYATPGDYLAARSARIAEQQARDAEWRKDLHIWATPLVSGWVTLYAVHPDDERAHFPAGWTWMPALRAWMRMVRSTESIQAQADIRQALTQKEKPQ